MPERDRLRLMQKIYDNLVDGGSFVYSEKIFSKNAKVHDILFRFRSSDKFWSSEN